MLLNMQKSALEHRAGGQSQFIESGRKNAAPLEEKRKKRYVACAAASRRNASPIFTSSEAARSRASQAYAEHARARSGAHVATRRLLLYM